MLITCNTIEKYHGHDLYAMKLQIQFKLQATDSPSRPKKKKNQ